jgi:hypothetical protein
MFRAARRPDHSDRLVVADEARAPKSRAGRRIVAFPAEIAPEIRWHL